MIANLDGLNVDDRCQCVIIHALFWWWWWWWWRWWWRWRCSLFTSLSRSSLGLSQPCKCPQNGRFPVLRLDLCTDELLTVGTSGVLGPRRISATQELSLLIVYLCVYVSSYPEPASMKQLRLRPASTATPHHWPLYRDCAWRWWCCSPSCLGHRSGHRRRTPRNRILLTMPVHVQLWQCDLCRTSRQCQSRTLYPMILREAGDQGCYVYPGTAPWCFWVCFPQAIESRNPLMAWWLRFPPCPKTLFWIGYASWRLVALAYYLFIYVSIYIYIYCTWECPTKFVELHRKQISVPPRYRRSQLESPCLPADMCIYICVCVYVIMIYYVYIRHIKYMYIYIYKYTFNKSYDIYI